MKHPTFSIIIATYKRPHLLERAIRSVLDQTYGDYECVVVDDSGDACNTGTAEVVRQFHDQRIVLIRHTSRKGVSAAYNSGIRASRGSLISILDDDDEYFPTFLEKMHGFFQTAHSRIGFAWTGIRRVKDTPGGETLWNERIWPAEFQDKETAYIAVTTIGNGFGLTIRKECLHAVGLYNESFRVCEDTEHLFRLARRFEFATIPEVLVKLHTHEGGQLTDRSLDVLRLELHERILTENAGFVAHYPKLYDAHYRRMAQSSFSMGMKKKGRKMLFKLAKNRPFNVCWPLDFVCCEWFAIDAETIWRQSGIRRLLSRGRKFLSQRIAAFVRPSCPAQGTGGEKGSCNGRCGT